MIEQQQSTLITLLGYLVQAARAFATAVAIVAVAIVAATLAALALVLTFTGRFLGELSRLLRTLLPWVQRIARAIVTGVAVAFGAGGTLGALWWVWSSYGPGLAALVLALTVIGLPAALGLAYGATPATALAIGALSLALAAAVVYLPAVIPILAPTVRTVAIFATLPHLFTLEDSPHA